MGILAYYCWFWRAESSACPLDNWLNFRELVDLEINEGWV